MTPEYILKKSLCRTPHCAGPWELRDVAFKEWPVEEREALRRSQEMELADMRFAAEYGEPGYDNPRKGILFADWNYFPREVDRLLEAAGFDVQWSDEWTVAENGKAYRDSPDSYGWRLSIVYGDNGEEFCRDEIQAGDYIDDYIEHLLDCPRHADVFDVNWAKHGFENMNGVFEAGLREQSNDDPKAILKEYQERFPSKEFLFQIPSVDQFDIRFTIWGRDKAIDPD